MAYEPVLPIEGNLLGDPELRFTPNGVAVCNLRVGLNDARPEQNNGKQGKELIAEIAVWRDMAENVAESLSARQRITAKVRMSEISAYINREGQPVGVLKLEALAIGPDLRWSTATPQKVQRGGGNQGQQNPQGGGDQPQQGQQGGWNNQGGDPWAGGGHPAQQGGAQQNQQGQGGGWGSDQGWGNGGGQQGGDPWGQ